MAQTLAEMLRNAVTAVGQMQPPLERDAHGWAHLFQDAMGSYVSAMLTQEVLPNNLGETLFGPITESTPVVVEALCDFEDHGEIFITAKTATEGIVRFQMTIQMDPVN
jgi:hypothetical protein